MNKYQKRKLEIYEEQLKINKEILEVQRDSLKLQLEIFKNRPQYVPIYVEKQTTTQPTWTYFDNKTGGNKC